MIKLVENDYPEGFRAREYFPELFPEADEVEFEPPKGLGDAVEMLAKPVGCFLDRWLGKAPTWLIKPQPFRSSIRFVPRARRGSALLEKFWPLPAFLRTRLCGCSACSRRRRFLNFLVPEVCSAAVWLRLFRHPASTLQAAYQAVYKAP